MQFIRLSVLLLLILSTVGYTKDTGADWPQWRGPSRDGLSPETDLIDGWREGGPKVLWRAASGDGYSAISIKEDRLYTMLGRESSEIIICLDAKSGKTFWQYSLDSKFKNQFGNGPRATPTVNNGIVYGISARGKLAALNSATGAEIWKKDLVAEYDAKVPNWGVSTSPLVYQNLLIVDVGGSGRNGLMAFDKKNGKVVWGTATSAPGYSAPIFFETDAAKHILNFSGKALISVNPQNGALRWSYEWITDYDVNAATPIFIAPDKVFISTGYGKGAAMLKVSANSVDEIWKSRAMRNHFSSSIYLNGFLFGFDNATLKCVDANTQKTLWAKRGFSKGSLLYADGRLIVLGEKGKLALVEAKPDAYVEQAVAQVLQGKCWTVPTLLNGKLYIRNQKEIQCLDFKKTK